MLGKLNMKEEQHQFLALFGQPPARLTVEQAAWVLGCQSHDVPILVSSRLLKPLGNPPPNGIKFFATAEFWNWSRTGRGLPRSTNTVNQHWQRQNSRKKSHSWMEHRMARLCFTLHPGRRNPVAALLCACLH